MESRFGADFSDVRVHTDSGAAHSAKALQANAYTTGRDIYFAQGRYSPETRESQHLLAHELTHTIQQRDIPGQRQTAASANEKFIIGAVDDPLEHEADRAADAVVHGTSELSDHASSVSAPDGQQAPAVVARLPAVQRQPAPAPLAAATPPPVTAPAPDAPTDEESVEYPGPAMPPIGKGARLTAEPELVHAQLRAMIIENGASQMISWVNGLEGMLLQGNSPTLADEQKKYGKGDVSGAPDPQVTLKQRVVAEFARSRARWETTIADVNRRFDEEIVTTVTDLLDQSEAFIYKQATRYGIVLDPTGNKIQSGGLAFPVPPERQGLKVAAQQILAAWSKKDRDKRMAQSLLTAPWDLLKIEQEFDTFRRDKIQEHPVLVAYARDREKLQELVAAKDPAADLEKEMNQKLDNIAWVRTHVEDHKDNLKLDPRIRNAAKRGMMVPNHSVEERVIEDQVQGIVADEAFAENVKTALGFGLLVLSFVPGEQLVAAVAGVAMMGADILGKFEDYLWEEAASGTALDRAAAISQSDPSLFRLGMEIAIGLGQGAIEAAAIGKAVELFKALAPVVREAVAARVAARAARTAASAEAATEALTRLETQGEVGKRVRQAIERGEFARDEGVIRQSADALGPPDGGTAGKKISGLPDAFSEATHEITVTRRGNIRCSGYCMELADSIVQRMEGVGLKNMTEEQRARGADLVKQARDARAKAADVTEGSPEETALAAKVETIDQAMVLLEREVGAAVQGRLGITRNYTGELQTARGRIGGIRELQEGKPGYGEMMRQCDEMANEVGDIQGQFDLIQRDLELAGQSRQQIDAYNAKATSLLQRIDELNKKLGGVEREQKSQLQALGEGAELYGKTDEENRQRLGDRQGRSREQMADEKISDLIAKKRDGSWLVTESKGGNIGDAETQLRNTIEHLVRAEPGAKGRIQARITITPEAMQRLSSPEGLAGYRVGEAGRLEVGPQGASKPVILPNTTGPVIVQVL